MERNRQFGRFVEVEVRDFQNKVKTIIGNDFEIEFDYFKSLDQTQEDDSGSIRIYGLTKDRVESMQSEGGEVRLRCGYINSDIETLFVASIVRLYSNKVDNTSVTTIECSANLLNYYFTGSASAQTATQPTIFNLAEIYGKRLGAAGTVVQLPKDPRIDEEAKNLLEIFVKGYLIRNSFVGSFETILKNFCETFGLIFRRVESEDGLFVAIFEVSFEGALNMLRITEEGYTRYTPDPNLVKSENLFTRTLKDDDESTTIVILNSESGLIEAKTEYKVATAYIDEQLSVDDVETLKSQQQRANDEVRKKNKDKKDAEREAKAALKGKKAKKSDWKKRDTIKVTRKYNRVKALLNPLVKPQTLLAVFESKDISEEDKVVGKTDNKNTRVLEGNIPNKDAIVDGTYGKYRVRNATYKGNNKRNDWIMDLYCEDSEATKAGEADLKSLERTTASENFQVEGLENLISEE